MNKEAVQKQITEALSKKLGDGFHLSVQKVFKTNLEADGVMIRRDGSPIAATVYLEPFYQGLENGISIDETAEMILQAYHCAQPPQAGLDVKSLLDFSKAKDRLYVQLVNKHCNQKLLADVPHSLFLDDFAVTVRCLVDLGLEGSSSFLVHNHHMQTWDMDRESLLRLALQNTRSRFGVELEAMDRFLMEMLHNEAAEGASSSPLWILTNRKRYAGASAVLFDDVLDGFAEKHGDFYVIFSSIHEALLLPAPDSPKPEELTRMNLEVNAEHVAADEILGTKAYFYKKGVGFVL